MKSTEAASLRVEMDQALSTTYANNASILVQRADSLIQTEVQSLASVERKHVVLKGLASLGDEVSEGIATAWARDGHVVLRKAANPGYGIEHSGGSQSNLLQVRTVGIGNPDETRGLSRDRDMVTIWCTEFERLQSSVGKPPHPGIEIFPGRSARPGDGLPVNIVRPGGRAAASWHRRQSDWH